MTLRNVQWPIIVSNQIEEFISIQKIKRIKTKTKIYSKTLGPPTWICLQSCPLAGSVIRRKVIGHFNETLIAVCSTPSSFNALLLVAALVKFLLTENRKYTELFTPWLSKYIVFALPMSKINIIKMRLFLFVAYFEHLSKIFINKLALTFIQVCLMT